MQEKNLNGKVALITGAGRRIGAAIAAQLHAAGARVVIHYHRSAQDAQALQQTLNGRRADSCFLVQGDLTDTEQLAGLVTETVAQAGRLDILVNNASTFYPTPLGQITEQHWDDLVGVNMKAPLFLAQAAMAQLVQHQGSIINLVDVHAVRPLPAHPVYCAAKAGLAMLTRSLAWELGPRVRVNGIAPGAILWPEQVMSTQQQQALLAKTALGRSGEPEDIAGLVLYLVRDAKFITGQIIPVDGGRTLNQ